MTQRKSRRKLKSKAKKPEREVVLEAVAILADWRSHKDDERFFNVEWKGFNETAWVAESEIKHLGIYHDYVKKYLYNPYQSEKPKRRKIIEKPQPDSESENDSEVIFEELTEEKKKRPTEALERRSKRQRVG